jgi:hypothetical protein
MEKNYENIKSMDYVGKGTWIITFTYYKKTHKLLYRNQANVTQFLGKTYSALTTQSKKEWGWKSAGNLIFADLVQKLKSEEK